MEALCINKHESVYVNGLNMRDKIIKKFPAQILFYSILHLELIPFNETAFHVNSREDKERTVTEFPPAMIKNGSNVMGTQAEGVTEEKG